jgi:eukaryotic-like serine/threonine-protein kinase
MERGDVVGQYRITELLGQGGMGAVYAVEHTLLGRLAAVKVLLPELSRDQEIVNRFFNEARAAAAIRHPGIIEIYDFGWNHDGAAYIVMERLQGESLAARSARARMPWSRTLAITRQIAGVLAAAHAKGIIHRDLKPDNVFLEPDPEVAGGERVKLLDFGIAKLVGDSGHQCQTRTGMVFGTPGYMAPEQCRGVAIDQRADLYALGCVLFDLCTGRPPFEGEGAGDVLAAHIHLPVPAMTSLVPGIPAEIEGLARRLLAKQPQDRVQTAEEVIEAIDAMAYPASPTGSLPIVRANGAPFEPAPTTPPGRHAGESLTTLSGASGAAPVVRGHRHARYWGFGAVAVAAVLAIYLSSAGSDPRSAAPSTAVEPSAGSTPADRTGPPRAPPGVHKRVLYRRRRARRPGPSRRRCPRCRGHRRSSRS